MNLVIPNNTENINNFNQVTSRSECRKILCYFKLAYTTKKFNAYIDPCKSRKDIYEEIKDLVNMYLFNDNPITNSSEFDIIIAGTDMAEDNQAFIPNGITLKNTVNFTSYDEIYAFYIKRKSVQLNECPICYNSCELISSFNCSHEFCRKCMCRWINNCNYRNITSNCPFCRSI